MTIRFNRVLGTGVFAEYYKPAVDRVEDLLWSDGDINRIAVSPEVFREFVRGSMQTARYARLGRKMAVDVVFACNRPARVYCDPELSGQAYRAENDPKVV